MAKNVYKCKGFQIWSKHAQAVFNRTYWYMLRNQSLLTHPKMVQMNRDQWRTIAWNAAWIAADSTDGMNTKVK